MNGSVCSSVAGWLMMMSSGVAPLAAVHQSTQSSFVQKIELASNGDLWGLYLHYSDDDDEGGTRGKGFSIMILWHSPATWAVARG